MSPSKCTASTPVAQAGTLDLHWQHQHPLPKESPEHLSQIPEDWFWESSSFAEDCFFNFMFTVPQPNTIALEFHKDEIIPNKLPPPLLHLKVMSDAQEDIKRVTTTGTRKVRTLNTVGGTGLLMHELSPSRNTLDRNTRTSDKQMQDYKLRWRGKHAAGAALVFSTLAQKRMLGYRSVNDQIIFSETSQISENGTASNYHTVEVEENVINSLYTELRNEVSRAHQNDIRIAMSNFSAGVQSGERMDYSVMGTYGVGQRNNRGERPLDLCYANDLYISNTKFKQAKPSRCWMKLLSSIQNSQSFPSADLGSDHHLVMANIQLKLRRGTPGKVDFKCVLCSSDGLCEEASLSPND
ncbi:hypothetical protein U0070_022806, partial [Myodes glareolus]